MKNRIGLALVFGVVGLAMVGACNNDDDDSPATGSGGDGGSAAESSGGASDGGSESGGATNGGSETGGGSNGGGSNGGAANGGGSNGGAANGGEGGSGIVDCGPLPGAGGAGGAGVALPDEDLAIVGTYPGSYGTTTVTNETWNAGWMGADIVTYSNDEQWLVGRVWGSDEWNPCAYVKYYWLENNEGLFYCSAMYDGESLQAALDFEPDMGQGGGGGAAPYEYPHCGAGEWTALASAGAGGAGGADSNGGAGGHAGGS